MRGCRAAIRSSAIAGPSGVRRPCSQLRTVWTLIPGKNPEEPDPGCVSLPEGTTRGHAIRVSCLRSWGRADAQVRLTFRNAVAAHDASTMWHRAIGPDWLMGVRYV